jgi:hypothetical protein
MLRTKHVPMCWKLNEEDPQFCYLITSNLVVQKSVGKRNRKNSAKIKSTRPTPFVPLIWNGEIVGF